MNGSKLAIRWEPGTGFAGVELDDLGNRNVERIGNHTRHVAQTNNTQHCPHCRSIIYSRRHRLCGVCSRELPDHCLFSEQEARRIEMLLRSEQERHRQWNQKVFQKVLDPTLIFD